jgi:flagellar basal body-associated protein FliL
LATNLKKPAEKDDKKSAEKVVKAAGAGGFDVKWVLAGLGFIAITMGSVVFGVHIAQMMMTPKTQVRLVERIIKPGPVVPVMASAVVNLKGGRYLRLSVALQFIANEKLWPSGGGGSGGHGAAKAVNPLEKYDALIKDSILGAAGGHSAEELLAPQGKEKLKREIRDRINAELKAASGGADDMHGALTPAAPMVNVAMAGGGGGGEESHDPAYPEVLKVYFTDFVIN